MKLVRTVTLILSTLLVVSLFQPPVAAKANPVPAPNSSAPSFKRAVKLTAAQKRFLNKASRTVKRNGSGKVLDYRIAIKSFRTKWSNHTDQRRAFAAGWMGYHSISHITAGERRKVVAIAKKHHTARYPNSVTATPMDGCTGASKMVDKGMHGYYGYGGYHSYWKYMNGCQVSTYLTVYDISFTIGSGLLAAIGKTPGALLAMVVDVIYTGGSRYDMQNTANHSDKHAVIIKMRKHMDLQGNTWYTYDYAKQ